MPAPSPVAATMIELLRLRSEQTPHQLALAFLADGEILTGTLTYGELNTRAQAIATELQRRQAEGERAILLFHSGLDYITAFWGCLYAGVIAVPAYPPHPKRPMPRLRAIAEDASAKFALTDSALHAKLSTSEYAEADLAGVTWIATDGIPSSMAQQWLPPLITGETLAFLQYTSGSTGTPKGVMITHANLLWTLEDINRSLGHSSASVMVSWLPVFHDLGLIYGMLTPAYVGFPCYFMPPAAFLAKPSRWLEAISRYRGTHTAAPNFAYDLCSRKLTAQQKATIDLRSLLVAINAAEPIQRETLDAFASAFAPCGFQASSFTPSYGLAESSVKVSAEWIGRGAQWLSLNSEALEHHRVELAVGSAKSSTIIGCGDTAIGAEIRIVDPERHTRCAADGVGEIWVKSPSVATGYWNRPDATNETFHAYLKDGGGGPFMRTGDLGFYRGGELYITGRLKDLLIIRGRNHYPQDIELTLEQSHPALRAGGCAAFAVKANGEEQVVVMHEIERQHLRSFDADEIFSAMRRALAQEHELEVHAIVLLRTGSIPKTSSGKIQRRQSKLLFLLLTDEAQPDWHLAEWRSSKSHSGEARSQQTKGRSMAAPNPTEKAIAQIWSELLELPTVGVRDDFFLLGGNSLLAAEMVTKVASHFQVVIPLEVLHDASTIEQLSVKVLGFMNGCGNRESQRPDARQSDPSERMTATERTLLEIFERLLEHHPISIHDDLGQLHKTPDLLVQLLAELRAAFPLYSEGFPITALRESLTIKAIAAMIDEATIPPASLVVCMQPLGQKPPLFLVHAGGGYVFFYRALVSRLGCDRPIYAIRAETEADGFGQPFSASESVELVAAHYLEEVKKIGHRGPYSLGGACMGGVIAFEMARQLEARGEVVAGPVLTFDSPVLNNPHATSEDQELLFRAFGVSSSTHGLSQIHRRAVSNLVHASRLGPVKGFSHLIGRGVALSQRLASHPVLSVRRLTSSFGFPSRGTVGSASLGVDPHANNAADSPEDIQATFMAQFLERSYSLLRSYIPGVYSGRVVIFQANESPDCAATWRQLASGGLDVHTLPGVHLDMLEEPTVTITAGLVNQCLDPIPAECSKERTHSVDLQPLAAE
jgi:acyl-CoA synthetase (AMP-forming)/AMP-acid ligase II/thioesterase domain-containing protein/acyl carrier protein